MATIKQIEEFVAMSRKVGECGLTICSSGNLSLRIGDEVMISGTGSWVPDLKPDQVSVCRLSDGQVLNGIRPSMESVFHLGVMRKRPDVGCVLHFQSPYATTVACMNNRPDNFNVTAEIPLHVGDEIPMIPFLRPGSKELADHVIDAMTNHNSIMLLKHGQVVCGRDFRQALERAMFFEFGCRIVLQANGNLDPLTNMEIDDLEEYFLGKVH